MTSQQPLNSKYYMNPNTEPSPPEAYLYGKGAYASPMSQTPPSASVSPTTLHSNHVNVRQLRQPRQPLYIPAALRPTDPPSGPTDIPNRPRAPDTPPASKDNSFDSINCSTSEPSTTALPTSESPFSPSDLTTLRRGLSRSASEGLDSEPGPITGPPTTAHWRPDVAAAHCALCQETFTWYFRRHHCRRCGDIVCDRHIAHRVPLDQNARYHPQGVPSKACDLCWKEWCAVETLRRHSRSSSLVGSEMGSEQGTLGVGGQQPPLSIPSQARGMIADEARVGSMARSEGMVWSTF